MQNVVRVSVSTRIDNAVRQIRRAPRDKIAGNGVIARINNSLINHCSIYSIVVCDICRGGTEVERGGKLHNHGILWSERLIHRMRNLRTVEHSVYHHLVGRNRGIQHVLESNLDMLAIQSATRHRFHQFLSLHIVCRDVRHMEPDRHFLAAALQIGYCEADIGSAGNIAVSTCHLRISVTRFLLA